MHNFFLKAESAWAKVVSDDLARWIDDGGSSTEFNLRATESFYKAFAYCHCRLIEHKPHTAAQANRVLIGEDVFNMVNRLRNKFNSVRDEEYKNKKVRTLRTLDEYAHAVVDGTTWSNVGSR
ncbi:hypothetical protein FRC08_018704 [Ceratobasidium sp. 394]|nr:hypothetical protein FRC08_018704 [Ceratobasidium sp. 394]